MAVGSCLVIARPRIYAFSRLLPLPMISCKGTLCCPSVSRGICLLYTSNEAGAYADSNIDQYAPIPWCGFVNWDDYLFRNGSHQNYEFSASGGQEKIKYYTSIGYMKQDGVTINSGLERISARLNVDYQMAKWMRCV